MEGFSVLIPIYMGDSAERLKKSLGSIIQDLVQPSEIVIVVDGPIGSDLEVVIKKFSDHQQTPVKIVRNEINRGLGYSLKIGVLECNYELIARMDADDQVLPGRFAAQLLVMQDPTVAIVGGYIEEVDDILLDKPESKLRLVPLSHGNIKKQLQVSNPFNHMTVMFRKSCILTVGNYCEMNRFEDYYLWLRLAKKQMKMMNIGKPLVRATAGKSLLKRRSGWCYLKDELHFFRTCYRQGLLGKASLVYALCLRIPSRLLPISFMGVVYSRLLRRDHA